MKRVKQVNLKELGNKYLLTQSFLLLVYFLLPQSIGKQILLMSLILTSLIPVFYILFKRKDKKLFIVLFFSFCLAGVIFIISFRQLRDFLPPTYISVEKIVGYAQYFGYPFYLDTIIFFVFILFPIVFLLIYKKFK